MNISIVILLALFLTSGFTHDSAYDPLDASKRGGPIPSYRPSSVGDPSFPDSTEPVTPDISSFIPSEYGQPTGKWFRQSVDFDEHFGFSSGQNLGEVGDGDDLIEFIVVHHPGAELQARVDKAPPKHLKMRLQLTKRGADFQRTELLKERTLTANALWNLNLFPEILPDKDDSIYVISAELLAEDGTVEDTATRTIVIPKMSVNAGLSIDKTDYGSGQEISLTIKNAGPLTLMTGTYYQIEKYEDGKWRKIVFDAVFEAVGLFIRPMSEYKETNRLPELEDGSYRIVKTIHVIDAHLQISLAQTFTVGP